MSQLLFVVVVVQIGLNIEELESLEELEDIEAKDIELEDLELEDTELEELELLEELEGLGVVVVVVVVLESGGQHGYAVSSAHLH
jgi:hypothetical protein